MQKIGNILLEEEIAKIAVDIDVDAHHPMGSSSMYRAKMCNASVLGNAHLRDFDSGNEASKEGTRIHKVIEDYIVSGIYPNDEVAMKHLNNAKVNLGNLIEIAQPEYRMCYNDLYFGTADIFAINGKEAYIIDWKTGRQYEAAEEGYELQLKSLGFAVLDNNPDVDVCYCRICYTADGSCGSLVICRREELKDWDVFVKDLYSKCFSKDAEFAEIAGQYCTFCKFGKSGQCPVLNAHADANAESVGLSVPTSNLPSCVQRADERLSKVKFLKKHLEEMESFDRNVIVSAGGSEHFKVTERKGMCKVDYKIAFEEMCKLFITEDEKKSLIDRHTRVGSPTIALVQINNKEDK